MVSSADIAKLLNHTALRDMQIRAFWQGLTYAKGSKFAKINIVCDTFGTGYKNVEKIIKGI
ncbi:hypothetical protein KA005_19110 [bacterium]|nr:hypothetical protein [bacterium]